LKDISNKTLAYGIKELENTGILERHSYNEIPPRVEYNITEKGRAGRVDYQPLAMDATMVG